MSSVFEDISRGYSSPITGKRLKCTEPNSLDTFSEGISAGQHHRKKKRKETNGEQNNKVRIRTFSYFQNEETREISETSGHVEMMFEIVRRHFDAHCDTSATSRPTPQPSSHTARRNYSFPLVAFLGTFLVPNKTGDYTQKRHKSPGRRRSGNKRTNRKERQQKRRNVK